AFDFPVLLRTPRADVAVRDPGFFHGQLERQGELVAVVRLQLAYPEGKRGLDLPKETVVEPPVQAQDPVPGAVVERGVLKEPLAPDADELHVDLDTIPGSLALEELELTRPPLANGLHPRQAELPDHSLDRGLRDAEAVYAPEPELRPGGAVAEVDARMPDDLDRRRGTAARAAAGTPGNYPAAAAPPPARPPASDRPRRHPKAPTRRPHSVRCRVVDHQQPFLHSQPVPPGYGRLPHHRQPLPLHAQPPPEPPLAKAR